MRDSTGNHTEAITRQIDDIGELGDVASTVSEANSELECRTFFCKFITD
jgi:hypothetical protein